MLQIIRSPQVFDVVVIGSGAGGGTAVKVLTDLGVNVALLEAGPMLNPAKDFKEHVLPVPGGPSRRRRRTPRCISAASSGWLLHRAQRLLGHRRRAVHRRARAASSAGSARASWADAPTTTAASRCASPITISSRTRRRPGHGLARHLRRDVALLRQGRRLHRRHRHQGRAAHRARRQFPAAHSRRACTRC